MHYFGAGLAERSRMVATMSADNPVRRLYAAYQDWRVSCTTKWVARPTSGPRWGGAVRGHAVAVTTGRMLYTAHAGAT